MFRPRENGKLLVSLKVMKWFRWTKQILCCVMTENIAKIMMHCHLLFYVSVSYVKCLKKICTLLVFFFICVHNFFLFSGSTVAKNNHKAQWFAVKSNSALKRVMSAQHRRACMFFTYMRVSCITYQFPVRARTSKTSCDMCPVLLEDKAKATL